MGLVKCLCTELAVGINISPGQILWDCALITCGKYGCKCHMLRHCKVQGHYVRSVCKKATERTGGLGRWEIFVVSPGTLIA